MRGTSLGAASAPILCALSLCALIGGIAGAAAEERLVQGMGRTLGWVVANASGALKFRDCRGRLIEARDGKVERATGRCPGPGQKLEMQGVIKTLDRENRVLVIEAGSGTPQGFYLADRAAVGAHWTELEAGQPVRVSGPTESRLQLKGYTPARLMRPTVVLSPVVPQRDAGMRTEPPVSLPSAMGTRPAATATPEPLLEPPGTWGVSCQGLWGVP